MLGASGTTERSGEIYLPYIGHLSDHIVLLEDGSIMSIARIDGVAFELEEIEMRNARCRAFNTLLRNIADDHVSIYAHLVRHADVPSSAPRHFRSVFAASLNEAFEQRVLSGQLLRNDHFLTLIVYPQAALGKVKRRFTKLSGKRENDLAGQIRNMEDLWHVVAGSLKAYGLHRLGIREKQGVLFTEIGEALRLIMTGRFTPVPVVSGSLGASIYTDRVICGKRGLEIRTPKDSYVGSIYSFREYPAKTRPGMLNALLSLDFPLVLTQSFSFLTRPQAHAKLSLKSSQMLSSGDKAVTQIGKLSEAEDALASNEFVMGSHHLSLCVYADDLNSLGDRGARARTRMADAGAVVVQEGIGMEAAYWSQLPGNFKWRTRPGAITSRNFAGFVSFENFPEGASSGHWGTAIARFRTNGGTPFDYIPHEHDVGMTAIFGPIGRGKTTLMMFVLAMLEQSMVDYAIMATAPFLWVLYIGRIVAGITGATGAVAGAYIADITDGDERARHFGFMSACFGFGMVAGPVLGGLMGGFSPHAPFFAAAALNGLNFLTGCFLLPESHKGERRPLRREALNPLASFRWARGMTVVAALMAVFFIMQLVGQVPAALWVIFGEDRFHWDATTIGISLAAFGILHSLAQAMITGPVAARLGERRALMLGMIADGTGYILLAFATRGWMAFPIMVLLASGGIGMPALQAMLSRQVDEERQGQLQGSLAALTSLTSIVGPLLFTAIYAASITTWNGWAWIAGAALYLLCLPALRRGLWSGAGQRADR
ncbi:MFS transporter [Agrobacterium rhizogenes]|nr:MFS transporter [Rhizobium rhizogenes]